MTEWTLSISDIVDEQEMARYVNALSALGFLCRYVDGSFYNCVFEHANGDGLASLWHVTKIQKNSHHKHKIAEFMMTHCDENITLYKGFYHKWLISNLTST